MGNGKKKEVRSTFRSEVFKRDRYVCRGCGRSCKPSEALEVMDAHHITDRTEMPNGGYVKENGITLCKEECHLKAEKFHSTGTAVSGFTPEDLYKLIGSTREEATEASKGNTKGS